MGFERERKYRVTSDGWRDAVETSTAYRQGYLCTGEGVTVRVRVAGGAAWLAVKGPTEGISRAEFEYPVPVGDAEEMLRELCRGTLVEKTRHVVAYRGLRWEIDEFEGANRGLVVAEVEVDSSERQVPVPAWAGAEVSGEPRFYNAALAEHPFSEWTTAERSGG